MTVELKKQTPITRATEQSGVGVTNPPLKKLRTDIQVEPKPERQDLIDLIPSLATTENARLVGTTRRKKHEGPRQNKKRVHDQPEPTVKAETEEKRPPRPVTPESVIRITEDHALHIVKTIRPSNETRWSTWKPGQFGRRTTFLAWLFIPYGDNS